MVPSPSMRKLESMSESQFKFRRADEEPLYLDEAPRPEVKIDMSKLEEELAAMRAAAKSDGDK